MGNVSSSTVGYGCCFWRRDKHLELKNAISDLDEQINLEQSKQKILSILRDAGPAILSNEPELMHETLNKTDRLIQIDAENFVAIVEAMIDIYEKLPSKPQEGLLTCLLRQLSENESEALAKRSEAVFQLIKVLVPTDSFASRTACLRMLIMKAKHISSTDELSIKWTRHLIDLLSFLLKEGADPTWIPRGDRSALFIFFQRIFIILAKEIYIANALMDLLPMFLTAKNLQRNEPDGTLLHALVNCHWEDLPRDVPMAFSEKCETLISKVVNPNYGIQDKTDENGDTALDIFTRMVIKDPMSGIRILTFFPLQDLMTNNSVPDSRLLLEIVSNASILMDSAHYVVAVQKLVGVYQAIPHKQEEGPLSCLIQQTDDRQNLSVFSRNQNKFLTLLKILGEVEEYFPIRLWKLNNALEKLEDLDQENEDILAYNAKEIFTKRPESFMEMVQTAHSKIESSQYLNFMKAMTEVYNTIPHKLEDGPLSWLLQEMNIEDKMKAFSKYQKNFFSLIEILNDVKEKDPQVSRSKFLRFLILRTEFTSKQNYFQWTVQLINTLKLLLWNGADPTQIPEAGLGSILYRYIQNIFLILAEKDREAGLKKELMDLFHIFLDDKYLKHKEPKGNVLHALVSGPWERLPINLLNVFIDQCQQTIGHAAEINPALLDETNQNGETALDILTKKIYCYGILAASPLRKLIQPLITEENMDNQNNFLETPLSWISMGTNKNEDYNYHAHNTFSNIQQVFIDRGANEELALAGGAGPALKWMKHQLGDMNSAYDRLHKLVMNMKSVKNWKTRLSQTIKLNSKAKRSLRNVTNAKMMPVLTEMLDVYVGNEFIASDIWRDTFPEYVEDITLNTLTILSVCSEKGGQPRHEQKEKFAPGLEALTREEEFVVPLLKIFLSMNDKDYIPKLDFLADYYIVTEDMIQLGHKLIQSLYMNHASCLKSESFIHWFLFAGKEEMKKVEKQGFYTKKFANNWLRRNVLHLAVIFLKSLRTLPENIIKAHINERDIHGCTPLHVAYLHQTEEAIQCLLDFGAEENIRDKFGLTPRDLGSRVNTLMFENKKSEGVLQKDTNFPKEDHPDVIHHQLCQDVFEAESGVLELCKPMMVFPTEAEELTNELQKLFQRLLTGSDFEEAEVAIAGSLREKLKSGKLNEGDIQLRFKGYSEYEDLSQSCYINGKHWHTNVFLKSLADTLILRLDEISWSGIYLRPISVKGPWKFIREGNSAYRGMLVSLDVVPILLNEKSDSSVKKMQQNVQKLQQEVLKGAPVHKRMECSIMKTWKNNNEFKETKFLFELDMTDSLPKPCRLAIVISKTLLQAYQVYHADSLQKTMPITSYTIKTALFYLLAYRTGYPKFSPSGLYSKKSVKILKFVLEQVESKVDQERYKLKFDESAKPSWTTDDDLKEHRGEATVWARKIFELIKRLAEKGWKLDNYWNRGDPVQKIKLYGGYGEAAYMQEMCDIVLERLSETVFFS